MSTTPTRYALVTGAQAFEQVDAYLPANYTAIWSGWFDGVTYSQDGSALAHDAKRVVVIEGRDDAGWTLDGYVIPRLQSGLIQAEEIDLSHDVMRQIPFG